MDHDRASCRAGRCTRSGAPTTSTGKSVCDASTTSAIDSLDLVEQRILQQQIVDRVGRQAELGKDHDRRAGLVALRGQPQRLAEIVGGVGHPGARHAAGDAHELVGVERIEVGIKGLGLRQ